MIQLRAAVAEGDPLIQVARNNITGSCRCTTNNVGLRAQENRNAGVRIRQSSSASIVCSDEVARKGVRLRADSRNSHALEIVTRNHIAR